MFQTKIVLFIAMKIGSILHIGMFSLHTFQKLRLFSIEDGDIFTTDSNLERLVNEESLFSGSSVILEYVDNNCVHLEDFKSYKPG